MRKKQTFEVKADSLIKKWGRKSRFDKWMDTFAKELALGTRKFFKFHTTIPKSNADKRYKIMITALYLFSLVSITAMYIFALRG